RANGDVEVLTATGLPLGLGVAGDLDSRYSVEKLLPGRRRHPRAVCRRRVTEARGANEEEYGVNRLSALLARGNANAPEELINRCMAEVTAFVNGYEWSDDLTILAIQRAQG